MLMAQERNKKKMRPFFLYNEKKTHTKENNKSLSEVSFASSLKINKINPMERTLNVPVSKYSLSQSPSSFPPLYLSNYSSNTKINS